MGSIHHSEDDSLHNYDTTTNDTNNTTIIHLCLSCIPKYKDEEYCPCCGHIWDDIQYQLDLKGFNHHLPFHKNNNHNSTNNNNKSKNNNKKKMEEYTNNSKLDRNNIKKNSNNKGKGNQRYNRKKNNKNETGVIIITTVIVITITHRDVLNLPNLKSLLEVLPKLI